MPPVHVILLNLEHVEDADLLIWAKVQEGLPEIKLVVLFSEVDGQTFQKAFEMKAQGFASLKTPPGGSYSWHHYGRDGCRLDRCSNSQPLFIPFKKR